MKLKNYIIFWKFLVQNIFKLFNKVNRWQSANESQYEAEPVYELTEEQYGNVTKLQKLLDNSRKIQKINLEKFYKSSRKIKDNSRTNSGKKFRKI